MMALAMGVYAEDRKPYYVGAAIVADEVASKGSEQAFTEHRAGEFSNGGFLVTAGYVVLKEDALANTVELRVGSSAMMETSENIRTSFVSAYYKPTYEVARRIGIYGLLGAQYVQMKGKYGDRESMFATALSGGVGAELRLAGDVYLFGDYTFTPTEKYLDYLGDEVNFSQIAVGVRYVW